MTLMRETKKSIRVRDRVALIYGMSKPRMNHLERLPREAMKKRHDDGIMRGKVP